MALGSMEYKEFLQRIGKDIRKIADDLYEATTEKIPARRAAAVVAAGKRKIGEYEDLVSQVEGAKRAEVEKQFGDVVADMRNYIRTLEKA